MLIFVKLGGSLITNKREEGSFRKDVVVQIANELRSALKENPDLRLVVGHGSGSFGHFAATRFDTIRGVRSPGEWQGFAYVATVAAELNYLIMRTFQQVGLPVWRIQPSASALCHDGSLISLAVDPIRTALEQALIPLVYGDVALDDVRGGTIISTETVFFHLAHYLPVSMILLLGEVDGVVGENNKVIQEINHRNAVILSDYIGTSDGVDVTGGMKSKVADMLSLTSKIPHLSIRIFNGKNPGILCDTLLGNRHPGTLIRWE